MRGRGCRSLKMLASHTWGQWSWTVLSPDWWAFPRNTQKDTQKLKDTPPHRPQNCKLCPRRLVCKRYSLAVGVITIKTGQTDRQNQRLAAVHLGNLLTLLSLITTVKYRGNTFTFYYAPLDSSYVFEGEKCASYGKLAKVPCRNLNLHSFWLSDINRVKI